MEKTRPHGGMPIHHPWARSILVLLVALTIGGILWQVEEKNHRKQYRLEIEVTVEQAGKRLSDWIADRMNLSRYLAGKWEDDYSQNIPRYRKDAAEFVEKFPGFQALNWIDADGVIRVVVPLIGNEAVLNVDLRKNPLPEVRDAVKRAGMEGRPTRTPAFINLIQGGRGFATYWPIFDAEDAHIGYINAVFRVDALIETCFARIQITNKYLCAVRERSGELVYPIDQGADYLQSINAASVPIEVVDQYWNLYMAPSPAFYENRPFDGHHLILPIALIVGLVLAGLERVLVQRGRALTFSQNQYMNLFEQAPIGYFSVSSTGVVDAANRVAETLTGKSKTVLVGTSFIELFSDIGNARGEILEQLDLVRSGAPISVEESRLRAADGSPLWVLVSVEGAYAADPELACFRIAVRDISKRKEAEEARSCLSAAIEQADEGMAITNATGIIQYANPAFFSANNSLEQQVLQRQLTEILREAGASRSTVSEVGDALEKGVRWQGNYSIPSDEHHRTQFIAILSPLREDDGDLSHFVLLQRDVTHEEELQSQLLQAQKLEAIGRFAGGIAHDFNNILQSLLGYASLARERREDQEEVDHCLEEIERSGLRAADLVAQILAFGRQSEQTRTVLWLQPIVEEVVGLIGGSLSNKIRQEIEIYGPQYPVVANATQIHQIVLNLASNAQHAMMPEGGLLRIRLGAESFEESGGLNPGLPAGPYMCVSVEDSGVGMTDTMIARVFEPYFTTREQGRGSGLGLATVHGLVEEHRGTIRVKSKPGKGTTFQVYLPIEPDAMRETSVAMESTHEPRKPKLPKKSSTPSELPTIRVLFVDDEAQIVDSMSRLLERFGYDVTGRPGSKEALETFQVDPQAFDVVVTDLSMPEMNGIEMAKALHEIRKDIPVILCSGFSETHEQDIEDNGHVIKSYLKKPVTAAKLRAAIDEVCAQA